MANRIHLDIDILHHINDLTFKVFRSETPGVDEKSTHIMDLEQDLSVKVKKMQYNEILTRNPLTPYAFFATRHFDVDTIEPVARMGTVSVNSAHLYTIPANKEIEIHNGDGGLYDGRPIYLDYEYTTQPVVDDYIAESGKNYFGPPANALLTVELVNYLQDFLSKKIGITWTYTPRTKAYYYRIFAHDKYNNKSVWSDEKMEQLYESNVTFRLQSSTDNVTWKDEAFTSLKEWFVDYQSADKPLNVQRLKVNPLSSKRSEITFENPWHTYKNYKRNGGYYRVRAEDDGGAYTDWITIGPIEINLEPSRVKIRRKLNNDTLSSESGTDAFTIFDLDATVINPADPSITLIDDQLTDKTVYSYTFFLEDEIGISAEPIMALSDHMKWSNIILFAGTKIEDDVEGDDFYLGFELSDEVIDIGVGKS